MSKDSIVQVVVIMAVCGVLVAGLGLWLGTPDKAKEEVVSNINEPLTAPLVADQLEAYQVDMTNNKNPIAVLSTNLGVIELELFEDTMPVTSGNFEKLAGEGFYDGVKFHRVIDGFMIQGGGFDTSMKQKETNAEIKNEADNGLTNDQYTVAMARTSVPDSASSQFFINVGDNGFLNHTSPTSSGWGYCVFGKVVAGMDVIDKIRLVKTGNKSGHQDVPVEPVIIEKASVV